MFSEIYFKIGVNVVYYRRLRKLTQEQLSEESGISRSVISDIERGKAVFKIDTLLLLAKALEIDYRELLK